MQLSLNQYKAGTVNYLNVVTAQATQLSNELTAVNLQGRRLTASVLLIKALGGGWHQPDTRSADKHPVARDPSAGSPSEGRRNHG